MGTTVEYQLRKESGSEFIWKGRPDDEGLLAHVLVNSRYKPPSELQFDEVFLKWESPDL